MYRVNLFINDSGVVILCIVTYYLHKLYPRSLNITVHITTKIPELPLLIKIEKVTNDNVYLLYYRFKIILIETETAEKRGH